MPYVGQALLARAQNRPPGRHGQAPISRARRLTLVWQRFSNKGTGATKSGTYQEFESLSLRQQVSDITRGNVDVSVLARLPRVSGLSCARCPLRERIPWALHVQRQPFLSTPLASSFLCHPMLSHATSIRFSNYYRSKIARRQPECVFCADPLRERSRSALRFGAGETHSLNSRGLLATYSAQSRRIILCTCSASKSPWGPLLPS